jgi:hypothetical protein
MQTFMSQTKGDPIHIQDMTPHALSIREGPGQSGA